MEQLEVLPARRRRHARRPTCSTASTSSSAPASPSTRTTTATASRSSSPPADAAESTPDANPSSSVALYRRTGQRTAVGSLEANASARTTGASTPAASFMSLTACRRRVRQRRDRRPARRAPRSPPVPVDEDGSKCSGPARERVGRCPAVGNQEVEGAQRHTADPPPCPRGRSRSALAVVSPVDESAYASAWPGMPGRTRGATNGGDDVHGHTPRTGGTPGLAQKVADRLAEPLSNRTPLDEDQVRAVVGSAFSS